MQSERRTRSNLLRVPASPPCGDGLLRGRGLRTWAQGLGEPRGLTATRATGCAWRRASSPRVLAARAPQAGLEDVVLCGRPVAACDKAQGMQGDGSRSAGAGLWRRGANASAAGRSAPWPNSKVVEDKCPGVPLSRCRPRPPQPRSTALVPHTRDALPHEQAWAWPGTFPHQSCALPFLLLLLPHPHPSGGVLGQRCPVQGTVSRQLSSPLCSLDSRGSPCWAIVPRRGPGACSDEAVPTRGPACRAGPVGPRLAVEPGPWLGWARRGTGCLQLRSVCPLLMAPGFWDRPRTCVPFPALPVLGWRSPLAWRRAAVSGQQAAVLPFLAERARQAQLGLRMHPQPPPVPPCAPGACALLVREGLPVCVCACACPA